MKYKLSCYEPPNWINPEEYKITYFVGNIGWNDEESANWYSELTGEPIEVYIPKNIQLELL